MDWKVNDVLPCVPGRPRCKCHFSCFNNEPEDFTVSLLDKPETKFYRPNP